MDELTHPKTPRDLYNAFHDTVKMVTNSDPDKMSFVATIAGINATETEKGINLQMAIGVGGPQNHVVKGILTLIDTLCQQAPIFQALFAVGFLERIENNMNMPSTSDSNHDLSNAAADEADPTAVKNALEALMEKTRTQH